MKIDQRFSWAILTSIVLGIASAATAAPYAVYELRVRGTEYQPSSTFTERLQHWVVVDLDPAASQALTFALVVPADGAVYLTDQAGGFGIADSVTKRGAPRSYAALSMNIVSHPVLENFIGHVVGRGRDTRQVLAPARRARTVRGVTVEAAPALVINDGGAPIRFASFLSGAGCTPQGMTYSGETEQLSGLGNFRMTMALNRTLTSVANFTGGVFVPPGRNSAAKAMPTVEEAGGPKEFLAELLLGLAFAEDDIVDLEPIPLFQFFRDADNDGFGTPDDSVMAAEQPPGYVANNTDCDDNDPSRNPAADEVCDGIDNNCNGINDDVNPSLLASDPQNCGFCFNACMGICSAGLCEPF